MKIPGLHADAVVVGLFLYVGPRKTVWRFRQRGKTRDKSGKRPTTARVLGTWPEVATEDARKAALALASNVAREGPPSKRAAATFETVWTQYLTYLEEKAHKAGKPARWALNAKKLADSLILPAWGKWTLFDMTQSPEAVNSGTRR